jgi:hypothetical protein
VFDKSQLTLSGVYTETVETPAFSFSNSVLPGYARVLMGAISASTAAQ